jgi:hypothetical protein
MINVPRYTALELDTAQIVEDYYYLENGYWMSNGKPDLNQPVERHYIVDVDGRHREIAENTLDGLGV